MCDSVVAVGAEAAGGVTHFARIRDGGPGERQSFLQLPAAHHPPLSRLRCTQVEIAQVAETYRVMGHSPEWAWGFAHGVNEHGVAIGNHGVDSNEPLEVETGLIGLDLVRLGLERGRNARESLEVIAGLLETHGQGGAALDPGSPGRHNSFLLADPESAWLLETSNRHWAARRVRSLAYSDRYALGRDWEIASRDLESSARSSGWWKRTGRIDVAAAFGNPRSASQGSEERLGRARDWLAEHRARHDSVSFRRLLGAHTAAATTAASLVAPLPALPVGPWPVWIGFTLPGCGIFLPVYLDGLLPERLARADEAGAWQSFERLRHGVARDPALLAPRLQQRFAALETQQERQRLAVEREARAASGASDPERAAQLVTTFMARSLEAALECAEALASALRNG